MTVRAIYEACRVDDAPAPYDTIHLKVYYPAAPDNSAEQVNMGRVPAADSNTPYPVAIMMPGTNVPVESYSWLAIALAEQNIVTVLYSWIKEDMPGFICLSPGIDLRYLTPDTYGTAPTAAALPALFSALERINQTANGVLEGRLDLDSIVIGGHSAGGSVALLNCNRNWFPNLKACFTYAAHTGASTQIGFPEDTMLPVSDSLPVLLMAGTQDGVIAASSFRYGDDSASGAADRIVRTFEDAITRNRGDCHLVQIEGANHFSFVCPKDGTTGRDFLDWEEQADGDELRRLMGTLVGQFIQQAVKPEDKQLTTLTETFSHPSIASVRSK